MDVCGLTVCPRVLLGWGTEVEGNTYHVRTRVLLTQVTLSPSISLSISRQLSTILLTDETRTLLQRFTVTLISPILST